MNWYFLFIVVIGIVYNGFFIKFWNLKVEFWFFLDLVFIFFCVSVLNF